MADSGEITELLAKMAEGNREAVNQLMPLVYDDLHRRAQRLMRQERSNHTLQPTALVHEAYLKLVQQRDPNFKNRTHFYAIAAHLMRRILADHARAHLSSKRGGGELRISLDESLHDQIPARADTPTALLAVDHALEKLAALDPRQEQIVELRFFGGLTVNEVAEVLAISPRTVEREWTLARAWLYLQIRDQNQG